MEVEEFFATTRHVPGTEIWAGTRGRRVVVVVRLVVVVAAFFWMAFSVVAVETPDFVVLAVMVVAVEVVVRD